MDFETIELSKRSQMTGKWQLFVHSWSWDMLRLGSSWMFVQEEKPATAGKSKGLRLSFYWRALYQFFRLQIECFSNLVLPMAPLRSLIVVSWQRRLREDCHRRGKVNSKSHKSRQTFPTSSGRSVAAKMKQYQALQMLGVFVLLFAKCFFV